MRINRSKYRNQKINADGKEFDSQLEYARYRQLKLLERAGEIKNLRLQVKFLLQPKYKKNGKTIKEILYIADFTYYDVRKGKMIIEDTKGYRTEIYKLKKKILMFFQCLGKLKKCMMKIFLVHHYIVLKVVIT